MHTGIVVRKYDPRKTAVIDVGNNYRYERPVTECRSSLLVFFLCLFELSVLGATAALCRSLALLSLSGVGLGSFPFCLFPAFSDLCSFRFVLGLKSHLVIS